MSAVSFVAIGAINDTAGVPRNAMSSAFFSNPFGRLERNDGTINNHHHQKPRTWMDTSLDKIDRKKLRMDNIDEHNR